VPDDENVRHLGPTPLENEFNLFVKADSLASEWEDKRLNPRAKRIARHLAVELAFFYAPCVITSIYRDDNPKSVHFWWGGVDLRLSVADDVGNAIRSRLNTWFPYRTEGKETIPPLRHGTAPHFHIQV